MNSEPNQNRLIIIYMNQFMEGFLYMAPQSDTHDPLTWRDE